VAVIRQQLLKKSTPEPRLFTIKMAAAYLSTSVWYIRQLVAEKKLPEVRFGNKLVFDRKTLDKFIDALTQDAAEKSSVKVPQ
jgi:excisionase family DNA binding protein